MMSMLGLALLTLTVSRCTEAFVPIGGGTSTHISITGTALLDIVRETCRDVVEGSGHEFEPTVRRSPRIKRTNIATPTDVHYSNHGNRESESLHLVVLCFFLTFSFFFCFFM